MCFIKELETKSIDEDSDYKQISLDPAFKKEIMKLKLKKMKKKNPRRYDLSKYIGFIDEGEPSDSVKEHDLI